MAQDAEAVIEMKNYRDDILYKKEIGFTTHPDGEMTFKVGYNGQNRSIMCLLSED